VNSFKKKKWRNAYEQVKHKKLTLMNERKSVLNGLKSVFNLRKIELVGMN